MSLSLSFDVFVAPGQPTTNPDIPPGVEHRSWSPITATLITAGDDAVLVDPLLTVAQSHALAQWMAERVGVLRSIYITHAHGDHWFGMGEVLRRFPGSRAVALAEVVAGMREQATPPTLTSMWETLFPGQIPTDLTPAEALREGETLEVDGHVLTPVRLGHTDSDDTTALHVPDLGLVIVGDAVYNNVHLYLTGSDAQGRRDWLAALEVIEELDPTAIVAGHKDPARPDDPAQIAQTRQYILDFEEGLRCTTGMTKLYEFMLERHPERINRGALWGSCRAARG